MGKTNQPETLGDKLALPPPKRPASIKPRQYAKRRISTLRIILGSAGIGLLVWLGSGERLYGGATALICAVALWLVTRPKPLPQPRRKRRHKGKARRHWLLESDRQGFMEQLRLDRKTALIDGNNIFHFGLAHKIGATPLWAIALSLRAEGYRIVCFFDANIYHTLDDNSELNNPQDRHSQEMLKEVFTLHPNEIYIVPSSQQADKFIIETLRHLPISFVVTNDRFRDYKSRNPFLAKNERWRKGVTIEGGEIRLFQHKFKRPLKV